MLEEGKIIEFDIKKQFKHIKPLGMGGTGDVYLFLDETTDMQFAIKKYSPKGSNKSDKNFKRFIDEIKILFTSSHPNIVRIYNYFLYPENKMGYLQMEYVEGDTIDKYDPMPWEKQWDDIFIDIISAFQYLSTINILHRDIKASNILIDKNGQVKIIDFGFGKQLTNNNRQNSILLNWPVNRLPNEVINEKKYNQQSEIYFLGAMFDKILFDKADELKAYPIVKKMIEPDSNKRYESFDQISLELSVSALADIQFTEDQKNAYRNLANEVTKHIAKFDDKFSPVHEIKTIMTSMKELLLENSLEIYIQSNSKLIRCFVNNAFTYRRIIDIEVSCVKDFYELLKALDVHKQKIVIDNLINRLTNIKIEFDDELPF